MDKQERGQWKLVFSKGASHAMTMGGTRPDWLLRADMNHFMFKAFDWDPGCMDKTAICVSAERNGDEGILKASLLFDEAGLAEIRESSGRTGKSVPDFIGERVANAIYNSRTRSWDKTCTLRVNPIESAAP